LPFLLVLAIATDILGLLVVAPRSPVASHAVGAVLVVMALGLAMLMQRQNVRGFWPYLGVCGTLSWFGFYWAGIHPALALIPIVSFLPHEPRSLDLFVDPPNDDDVHRFEHEWNEVVQVVLFLFGLVNAGVLMRGYYTGTWAVLAAALVGRPLGILTGVALGHAAGLQLPRRVGWRQVIVIAMATSSGFTFALFLATSALPIGPTLAQIKIGALISVVGALMTVAAARLLRVGRFAK
jgi:NhaA family Na+:H+ antiporter